MCLGTAGVLLCPSLEEGAARGEADFAVVCELADDLAGNAVEVVADGETRAVVRIRLAGVGGEAAVGALVSAAIDSFPLRLLQVPYVQAMHSSGASFVAGRRVKAVKSRRG